MELPVPLLLPLHVRVALEDTLGHRFLSLSYLDKKVALVYVYIYRTEFTYFIPVFQRSSSNVEQECFDAGFLFLLAAHRCR